MAAIEEWLEQQRLLDAPADYEFSTAKASIPGEVPASIAIQVARSVAISTSGSPDAFST